MKNLKKVLALVLAFACAFTMFAGAVVYPDVPAGSEYSEAITMLSDLGIIQGKDDGKYHSEDTITRAEACALIARMLTGDPQVSQYAGASNFTDVVKGSWKESVVGYCVVNGITVGVGNNKFEPDRAITDAEFVTMVVRAMGYETTGTSYPYGHISAAQANGLLDDVTVVPSSAALRGEDAQIIYNALFADYARGAKRINTTHGTTVEEYPTIAEDVFNLAKLSVAKGDNADKAEFRAEDEDFACYAHTWVIAGADTRTDDNQYVAYRINDKDNDLVKETVTFTYDGDVSSLLGYQVELWGDIDHKGDVKEVVAIKTVKGQTAVEWNPSMETDGTKAIVDDEKYQTKTAAMPVRNTEKLHGAESVFTQEKGDAFKLVTEKAIMDIMEVKTGNSYRLVDWDSDGDVDFVVKTDRAYAEVTALSKTKITLATKTSSKTLDLDDDNLIIKADGVEKDDIVEIVETDRSWTKSDKEIVTITLTAIEPETKELTKVSTSNKLQVYFDVDKTYIADNSDWNTVKWDDPSNKKYDEDDVDTEFDLYVNANGMIVKSAETDSDAKGYLIVLDTENGYDGLGSKYEPITIKAMLDDGSVKEFDLDDDDIFKNADKSDYKDVTASKGKVLSVDENKVVGVVFKYYTNDEGVITKLIKATDAEKQYAAETADVKAYNDNTHVLKLRDSNLTNQNLDLDTAKVMFVVDDKAIEYNAANQDWWSLDEDDVAVISKDDLDDIEVNNTVKLLKKTDGAHVYGANQIAYKANSDGEAEAFVMALSNFDDMGHGKYVGLVTWAAKSGSAIEVTAAVHGKTEVFSTNKKVDVEDIFKAEGVATTNLDEMKEVQAAIGNGRYAMMSFDKDGNVTKVEFFSNDDMKSVDNKYEVKRLVVGNKVSTKYLSYLDETVTFADEDTFNKVTNINWKDDVEYDDDAVFYVIDSKPTTSDEKYDTVVLSAKNGFAEDSIYKKSKDSLKISVGSVEDVKASYIKGTDADTFRVVDVIIKDADKAVATYIFDKDMESTNTTVVYSTTVVADATTAFVPFSTKTDGQAQKNTLTFTGAVDVNSLNLTIKALGTEVVVAMANGDDAVQAAIKAEAALKSGLGSKATVDRNNNVVTIAATQAAAHQNILLNGQDLNVTVHVLTVTRDRLQQGVAPTNDAKASATLKIKNAAYKYTSGTTLTISADVYSHTAPNASVGTQTATVTLKAGVVYTADEIASALASALKTAIGTTWKVEVSATDNVVSIVADSAKVGGVGDMIKLTLA